MRPPGGSSNVRRQPKESAYLPPTPLNSHRDSDVSLASSRPSSVGIHSLDVYKDRSYQQNATATINSFLASQDLNVSFKPFSSPSAKHIHQTLIFRVGLNKSVQSCQWNTVREKEKTNWRGSRC
ncbi:unnamed protein product [Vicia faba]|uniref:Uncharacterized protein n=1 Tax=Vicia faba TaxID=3906 RepID=A0AAV0ZR11_VICFA|nr:unnamed protein product [Vicia faba]